MDNDEIQMMEEEEAWTEEYFAKQDCGYVEGEPPTYQWVVIENNE